MTHTLKCYCCFCFSSLQRGLAPPKELRLSWPTLGRAPPQRGYFNPWVYTNPVPETWEADGWEVPEMPHASREVESPTTAQACPKIAPLVLGCRADIPGVVVAAPVPTNLGLVQVPRRSWGCWAWAGLALGLELSPGDGRQDTPNCF